MQEEQAVEKRPWIKPVLHELTVEDTEINFSIGSDFGCLS
jgi:hypothetical protein